MAVDLSSKQRNYWTGKIVLLQGMNIHQANMSPQTVSYDVITRREGESCSAVALSTVFAFCSKEAANLLRCKKFKFFFLNISV